MHQYLFYHALMEQAIYILLGILLILAAHFFCIW